MKLANSYDCYSWFWTVFPWILVDFSWVLSWVWNQTLCFQSLIEVLGCSGVVTHSHFTPKCTKGHSPGVNLAKVGLQIALHTKCLVK